jgi:hypothetical protein
MPDKQQQACCHDLHSIHQNLRENFFMTLTIPLGWDRRQKSIHF